MARKTTYSIEYIKSLGKEKFDDNFDLLLKIFKEDLPIDIKREVVSSIGRQNNLDRTLNFIKNEAFNDHPMELVYQMFRTCLYKKDKDDRFDKLGKQILEYYNNGWKTKRIFNPKEMSTNKDNLTNYVDVFESGATKIRFFIRTNYVNNTNNRGRMVVGNINYKYGI